VAESRTEAGDRQTDNHSQKRTLPANRGEGICQCTLSSLHDYSTMTVRSNSLDIALTVCRSVGVNHGGQGGTSPSQFQVGYGNANPHIFPRIHQNTPFQAKKSFFLESGLAPLQTPQSVYPTHHPKQAFWAYLCVPFQNSNQVYASYRSRHN